MKVILVIMLFSHSIAQAGFFDEFSFKKFFKSFFSQDEKTEEVKKVVSEKVTCEITTTDELPPFYISAGFGKSIREEAEALKKFKNKKKYKSISRDKRISNKGDYYLPHGSIVKILNPKDHKKFLGGYTEVKRKGKEYIIDTKPVEGITKDQKKNTYVPVEVISTKKENTINLFKKFDEKYRGWRKRFFNKKYGRYQKVNQKQYLENDPLGEGTQSGTIGHITNKSLRKIDEFTYFIKKETELLQLPDDLKEKYKNKALRIKQNDEGYVMKECCKGQSEDCVRYYTFEVVDDKGEVIEDLYTDEQCLEKFLGDVNALPERDTRQIQSLLRVIQESDESRPDLNFEDLYYAYSGRAQNHGERGWNTVGYNRGYVYLPTDEEPERYDNHCYYRGPSNIYHYTNKINNCDREDLSLKPGPMCSFLQTAKKFQAVCERIINRILSASDPKSKDWQKKAKLAWYASRGDYHNIEKLPRGKVDEYAKKADSYLDKLDLQKTFCKIQVGDMYQRDGYTTTNKEGEKVFVGHFSHDGGDCIDIRLFNYGGILRGFDMRSLPDFYMTEMTSAFIQTAFAYGGMSLFSDKKSGLSTSWSWKNEDETTPYVNLDSFHHDHIHICYNEEFLSFKRKDKTERMKAIKDCRQRKDLTLDKNFERMFNGPLVGDNIDKSQNSIKLEQNGFPYNWNGPFRDDNAQKAP